ncbi:MAG TPA: hypothetical protein VLG16_03040 [Candidatus Saccharimonadales bacterium]|nr:hypothetical protein [Candidatus Saccharimonadales bacterium]
MSEVSTRPEIPTFFSERAFEELHGKIEAVEYSAVAWAAIGSLARFFNYNELPPLEGSTVVFRYGSQFPEQPRDPSIFEVDESAPLFYAGTDLSSSAAEAKTLTRSSYRDIQQASGKRKPFEIMVNNSDLVGGLIHTLMGPPEYYLTPPVGSYIPDHATQETKRQEFESDVRSTFAHAIQTTFKEDSQR